MNTRKYVVNTLAVIGVCVPMVAQSAPIPVAESNAKEFAGHWYDLISKANVTWELARDDATTREIMLENGDILTGHLATITSQVENDFIDTEIGSSGGIGWIGGFQTSDSASPTDGWNWVTGEEWNFTNWDVGEPNDQGPGSGDPLFQENNGENVLEIRSNGNWNDFKDTVKYNSYVIEYEPALAAVPVPAAVWLFGSGLLGLVAVARRKKSH